IISVISGISGVNVKRCEKLIQPTNCTIQKCRSDCSNMFKSLLEPFGECIQNTKTNTYECFCFYDCNATPHLV
ncbi:hypothetical protein VIGAN_09078500, partial [Vigna angularis var. angularis]